MVGITVKRMSTHRYGTPGRVAAWGLALMILSLAGGCRNGVPLYISGAHQPAPAGGVDFGKFNKTPKPRVGSLPYPGLFTLFELADPDDLGHHAYDVQSDGEREQIRGILYTCRGGFIDVAHLRKSADLCKYVAVRMEMALLNDWSAIRLKSLEPSVFVMHLQYPHFWNSLAPAEKQRLARELSIRIAQRMAMLMITWHEMLTWFGYQATVVLPEKQSAFTYDDTGSHSFGVMVGGRALRDESRSYDAAVTHAIDSSLRELGVVSPDETMEAIRQVKGLWWRGFEPLKRQFECSLDGRPVEAWIVRGLPFGQDAQPYRYELPPLSDVMGYDFSDLYRVEIQPRVWQSGSIRAVIPGKPSVLDAQKDLPIIMDYMRQWHVKRDGEQVLHPY